VAALSNKRIEQNARRYNRPEARARLLMRNTLGERCQRERGTEVIRTSGLPLSAGDSPNGTTTECRVPRPAVLRRGTQAPPSSSGCQVLLSCAAPCGFRSCRHRAACRSNPPVPRDESVCAFCPSRRATVESSCGEPRSRVRPDRLLVAQQWHRADSHTLHSDDRLSAAAHAKHVRPNPEGDSG
jgi:hypothetical protein